MIRVEFRHDQTRFLVPPLPQYRGFEGYFRPCIGRDIREYAGRSPN